MLSDKDINLLAAKILSEGQDLSEKILEPNNPSVEFNQYFSDVSDIIYRLQDLYYKSSGNRNSMVKEGIAMIKSIIDRSNLAINRIEISPPEDTNEAAERPSNKELAGSTVIGVGGENKLINVTFSPDNPNQIVFQDEADIISFHDARMGKDAPVFLQIGGHYYNVIDFNEEKSGRIIGMLSFDKSKSFDKVYVTKVLQNYKPKYKSMKTQFV